MKRFRYKNVMMVAGISITLSMGGGVAFPDVSFAQEAELGPVKPIEVDAKKALLGKRLFFDPRLSGDAEISCSTCHQPSKAFTDGLALSAAYPGSNGFGNTPTLMNVAVKANWFRLGLIEALALLGDAGFEYLAKAAGDENCQVRLAALTALNDMANGQPWPNRASEAMLAALNGELVEPPVEEDIQDEDARSDVADEQLPELETEPEEDVLTLEEDSPAGAMSTLGKMLSKGIETEMVPEDEGEPEEITLSEDDERYLSISQIRKIRKKKISMDIKIAPHQDVRRYAARLLSESGAPEVHRLLLDNLDQEDEELILAILDTLSFQQSRLLEVDESEIAKILELTSNGNLNIRVLAIRCLSNIDSDPVRACLIALVANENVHIRQEAMTALAGISDVRQIWVDGLDDSYSGVRMAAASALIGARDEQTISQLVALSTLHDGMHRSDLVDMLAGIDLMETAQCYLNILSDENRKRVWQVSIAALGQLFSRSGQFDQADDSLAA